MNVVDQEVKRLIRSMPNEEILLLLKQFKELKGYKSYEGALDAFAYKFGLGWNNNPHETKKGYRPYIVYSPENALSYPHHLEPVSDDLMPLSKSVSFVIRELIVRLSRVPEARSYLDKSIWER